MPDTQVQGVVDTLAERRGKRLSTHTPPLGIRLRFAHGPDFIPQRRGFRIAVELLEEKRQALRRFEIVRIDVHGALVGGDRLLE